jgi:hypothetical protein
MEELCLRNPPQYTSKRNSVPLEMRLCEKVFGSMSLAAAETIVL